MVKPIGELNKRQMETIKNNYKGSPYIYPGTININDTPKYAAELIKNAICEMYSITIEEIKSPRRNKGITELRHIMAYLIKKNIKNRIILAGVGEHIGRDHASVIHAIKKVRNWMDTDSAFKRKVKRIEKNINELGLK